MRLRPNGDSGPLVCSLGMLEEYFYVQGREWERYAWIKGRLVSETSSDAAMRLAKQLDALVTPFVYRRYLDYGAIAAIRSLHRRFARKRSVVPPCAPTKPTTSSSGAAGSAKSNSARRCSS